MPTPSIPGSSSAATFSCPQYQVLVDGISRFPARKTSLIPTHAATLIFVWAGIVSSAGFVCSFGSEFMLSSPRGSNS